MKVKLSDLKTPEVFLEIEEKRYQLTPYTLNVEAWCYDEFASDEEPDGRKNLDERLSNNDVKAYLKVCYAMIIDKADFTTFDVFYKKIKKYQGAFELIQLVVIKAIRQTHPEAVQDPEEVKKKFWQTMAALELIGLIYMIYLLLGTHTP